MAGAREIKAGEAFVVISAKMDSLRADLRKTQNEMRTWGNNLSNIGGIISGLWAGLTTGAVAGAFTALVRSFVDAGSVLNDLSMRTGLSATSLTHLKFAAEQSGASLADIETAIRTMAKNGMNIAEFEALGQSIAAIQDPTERAAKAVEMFGRGGMRLIPMFQDWNALKSSSQAIGGILTDEEVKAADALGDAFGALRESVSRLMQTMGAVFGDTLIGMLETAIGMVSKFTELLRTMTDFGSGGDFLDKWAEFMDTGSGQFWQRGHDILQGMSKSSPRANPFAEADAMGADTATAAGMREEQIWDAIRSAHERRNALIQSFETPAEQFLRRQQEIIEAMKALNRNRLLGFVSEQEASSQQRGLQTSLARLQSQERQRIAEERERMMADMMGRQQNVRASLAGGAIGTTNAGAARLLGRGGDAVERKMDEQTNLLRDIKKNTGRTVSGVAFS